MDVVSQSLALLSMRPHIIVGTPGRLVNLLTGQTMISMMRRLCALVLDGADQLTSNSQSSDLQRIFAALDAAGCARHLQVLLYSATCTPRLEACSASLGAVKVECTPKSPVCVISQEYVLCPNRVKISRLVQVLAAYSLCHASRLAGLELPQSESSKRPGPTIIFVQTCKRVHQLHTHLKHLGVAAFCLHSKVLQQGRR